MGQVFFGQSGLFEGLALCVEVNSESYHNDCDSLTEYQINLLKAYVNGEQMLSSATSIKKYNIGTSATVTKNQKVLGQMDILQDPVFIIWFKRNFMGIT